jgi:hypothetical protein
MRPPGNLRPRYVNAQHPGTGQQRQIVVGDATNDLWNGKQTTITLRDYKAGTETAYLLQGRIAERRRG